MIIGLTGGMGCGKSTAAKRFVELGYHLIDSDQIVREEILTDPAVVELIRARWGDEMVDADGIVVRKLLAQRVFSDDAEREQLESWVHPRLFERWRERFGQGEKVDWVVEVPLLFEQRLENWFDFVVCVASSAPVQLARLSERGISHTLAGQRISKQLPLARKLDLADVVLWNDGSPLFLQQQVDRTHEELTSSR